MKSSALSRLKANLPAQPGIHGRNRYLHTAVFVPLIPFSDGYHLLFEERADGIRQAGEICFPGGKVDPADPDICTTALRETVEELGISPDALSVLGPMDTLITAMGLMVQPIVGSMTLASMETLSPNPDEVARVFTVPLSWFHNTPPRTHSIQLMAHPTVRNQNNEEKILLPAKELGLPDRYTRPWGGLRYPVHFWHHEKGMIWGITAEIIHALLDFLPEEER